METLLMEANSLEDARAGEVADSGGETLLSEEVIDDGLPHRDGSRRDCRGRDCSGSALHACGCGCPVGEQCRLAQIDLDRRSGIQAAGRRQPNQTIRAFCVLRGA